jgi:hypothetical protein
MLQPGRKGPTHGGAGIIRAMHVVIAFAVPATEAGLATARSLQLPALWQRLGAWSPSGRDDGDAWSLSPPHERALARAHGWAGGDGALPFAAQAAQADGIHPGDGTGLAWGLVTPAHWHLGTEQVSLVDPAALVLDEAASRALFSAVAPLFIAEGFAFTWGARERWYAAHESLAELATASLDRVIGRNVDRWLGSDPAVRRVRRLQAEVQMLLHDHPLNAERGKLGLLPVNSFWLSGCGVFQPARGDVRLDTRLRAAALAEDWAAWAKAWAVVDAELAAGGAGAITLCGERAGATFGPAARGWAGPTFWQRRRGAAAFAQLLEAL